jgi:hypothetical protein
MYIALCLFVLSNSQPDPLPAPYQDGVHQEQPRDGGQRHHCQHYVPQHHRSGPPVVPHLDRAAGGWCLNVVLKTPRHPRVWLMGPHSTKCVVACGAILTATRATWQQRHGLQLRIPQCVLRSRIWRMLLSLAWLLWALHCVRMPSEPTCVYVCGGCACVAVIPQCPTQPLVSMSNITLQDVYMTGGLTLPGVLLLDPANPGACPNSR